MQTLYIYVHTLYVYIWVSVYRSLRLLSALGHCMRKTAVVNCRSRNQIKINKFNIHIDIWITTAAAVLCVCECDWRLCAWGSPSKLLAGRYTWTMCTSICNSLKTLNKQMNKNNNNNNKNLHTDIQMEINVVAAAFGTNWSSDLYERERKKERAKTKNQDFGHAAGLYKWRASLVRTIDTMSVCTKLRYAAYGIPLDSFNFQFYSLWINISGWAYGFTSLMQSSSRASTPTPFYPQFYSQGHWLLHRCVCVSLQHQHDHYRQSKLATKSQMEKNVEKIDAQK